MSSLPPWSLVFIDDEKDIREVMTIALEDAGYRVRSAADGSAGIRLCESEAPQIVITDIRMPGLSGIEVLEALKALDPHIEVIVCTAFGEMELAIQALQRDASDFITKPVNDQALHLALKRAQERYLARKKIRDYTAFLEAENAQTVQELKKTFAFQKNLLESSMDGILAGDETGRVVIFNRSMERLLGMTKTQALGRMTFDQCFAAGEFERFQKALAAETFGGTGRLFLFETTLADASGRRVPVQVSAATLFDCQEKSGWVCFFRDLREIHRLEREFADQARILHQDKMMSLGRLAASMVHEINNPLAGILNYIRLMLRIVTRGPLAEPQRVKFQEYLQMVESETGRCSQIVSSLLTFSRKSPLSFEPVSIGRLIDRCALLSRHKLELQHIDLETQFAADLPEVTGDFNQLQQCIINLIFNAIDAMPEGGTLTLAGYHDAAASKVIVSVRDTGSGIAEADLPHIFEPFFTTKQEGYGVGLGLSTVFGIIERHGGSVRVESREGIGTTFRIELPAKPAG